MEGVVEMTDLVLRKICPNSGEKCDCPKGICNTAVANLVERLAASPQGDYWNGVNETPVSPPALCEDEGCPQLGTPHVCILPNEQERIDRQEAGSLKYAMCAQVLLLSSGKFALFGPYSMQDGIPLLAIDTWAGLEPHVRAYRKTAEDGYQQEKLVEEQRRNSRMTKAAADYDSLFEEES